jgi:hypothetical protein
LICVSSSKLESKNILLSNVVGHKPKRRALTSKVEQEHRPELYDLVVEPWSMDSICGLARCFCCWAPHKSSISYVILVKHALPDSQVG